MIHWNKNERPGQVRTGGRAVEVKVKKGLADESKEVLFFFIIYLILIYIFIITFYFLFTIY